MADHKSALRQFLLNCPIEKIMACSTDGAFNKILFLCQLFIAPWYDLAKRTKFHPANLLTGVFRWTLAYGVKFTLKMLGSVFVKSWRLGHQPYFNPDTLEKLQQCVASLNGEEIEKAAVENL